MANYATRHAKSHTVRNIIIVVIILIILIPVALVLVLYILITDTTRIDKDFDTGLTFTEVMNDMMFDLFTFQEGEDGNLYLMVNMSDDDLSAAMHTMLVNYMDSLGGIIDNYYISMDDDKFDIAVEASIWIIETKVTISCSLDTVIDEENPENSYIYFAIDELIIGQLSGLRDIALDIVELFIDLDDIAAALRDGGFSLYYDSERVAFTYTLSDLFNDVLGTADMGNASLYINSFIDTLLENNLLYAGVSDNNIVVSVNVTDFVSDKRDDAIDFESILGMTEYLLSEGIISGEVEANAVLTYLLVGWDSISSEYKSIIDGLDLSSIGITEDDKYTYTGEKGKYNSDINSVFETTIASIDGEQIILDALRNEEYSYVNLDIASISISDISSYLGSISINGSAYYMINDNQVRDIGVSNIMCYYDELRSVFTIGITLDFSGYSIDIGIEYEVRNTENELRLYYIGNFMGSYQMNRDSITSYMDMIGESINDNDYFSIDSDFFVIDLNLDTETVFGSYADYVNDDFMINYDFYEDSIEINCSFSLNETNIQNMVGSAIQEQLEGSSYDFEGLSDYYASRWKELMIAYLDEELDAECCYYQILRDFFVYEYQGEEGETQPPYTKNVILAALDEYLRGQGYTIDDEGKLTPPDRTEEEGDQGDGGDTGNTGDDGGGGNDGGGNDDTP